MKFQTERMSERLFLICLIDFRSKHWGFRFLIDTINLYSYSVVKFPKLHYCVKEFFFRSKFEISKLSFNLSTSFCNRGLSGKWDRQVSIAPNMVKIFICIFTSSFKSSSCWKINFQFYVSLHMVEDYWHEYPHILTGSRYPRFKLTHRDNERKRAPYVHIAFLNFSYDNIIIFQSGGMKLD